MWKYFKAEPNQFIQRYRAGKLKDTGKGLSFFYLPYNTTIVLVPTESQDSPFLFSDVSADFQEVSVQGQVSWRITDAKGAIETHNFTLDPRRRVYRGDPMEAIIQRLTAAIQDHAGQVLRAEPLETLLGKTAEVASSIRKGLAADGSVVSGGLSIEGLYIQSLTANPETRKALEAEYRESLLRRADQAIYARRAAAVEDERQIKQNELETEIDLQRRKAARAKSAALENRALEQERLQTHIELAEKRKVLVALEAENQCAAAEGEVAADSLRFEAWQQVRPMDWIGSGLKEWLQRGGSIESLHITPELLSELVRAARRDPLPDTNLIGNSQAE